MAALLPGGISDAFRLLTGLAGDAFPARCCVLSSDAYPAFSLQTPDSLIPVRVESGMWRRKSESPTPEAGRRRLGCPQVGCLWSGRRTNVGIVATV